MSTENTIHIPKPELRDGEKWVGSVIVQGCTMLRHVILLPGESEPQSQPRQLEWARDIGGELPDKLAGALLFAEAKSDFKPEAYWLNEQHAADSSYAWYQHFGYGSQDDGHKSYELRARAVRSEFLVISH